MTHDHCKHYPIIPVLILTVYTGILYTSHKLLANLPGPIPWLAPVAAILIIPALVTIRDTIHILGGPKKYFCSGARMLRSLISRGARCTGPTVIIVEGPFSHTRHPVYSSTLLITIALTIVDPRLLLSIPIVVVWVTLASIVEERELAQAEEYRRYRERVPRLSIVGVIRYGYSRILGNPR
ncbi:MAG: isoprenylcysteine carboxylmethyltransferase family protein [Desulfurococcales archaeon]|nr:isoprenylcysteine carboxylmethyltransferase family protein [Desulfurococcales archaeon]